MKELRRFLVTHFNESELKDLCFDLRVDYEKLDGSNKADKARELLAHMRRHNRLEEFVIALTNIRSNFTSFITSYGYGELRDQVQDISLLTLRKNLKERQDLKLLGEAVYEAEALHSEGKLPNDLDEVYYSARLAYDEIRIRHGECSTMMRNGDLEAKKIALDKIAEMVGHGDKFLFDTGINDYRPIVEALEEAYRLYEEGSADTLQYEIDRINKSLPRHPYWAADRLRESLNLPFLDSHKDILQNKLQEVEELADKQQSVREFVEQHLTIQEQQIAHLVVEGQNPHSIARTTHRNIASVDIEVKRICSKLKIHFGIKFADTTTLTTMLSGHFRKD